MVKVFLDELPKHTNGIYKGCIDWTNSIGKNLRFKYEEDEKLVAYRIGLIFVYDQYGYEYLEHGDFHFKQWEGDYWTDKPGSGNLRFEEETIDGMLNKVWVNSWWDGAGYDSDVILFAVKKG